MASRVPAPAEPAQDASARASLPSMCTTAGRLPPGPVPSIAMVAFVLGGIAMVLAELAAVLDRGRAPGRLA